MAKNLSERIAARMVKKKPARNAQNRAAFLTLREDIKQALDDSWPVKSIWETLREEGKVDYSYQAFRGYVNRLILSPRAAVTSTDKVVVYPRQSNQIIEKKIEQPAVTGFTFNKTPNKEELL